MITPEKYIENAKYNPFNIHYNPIEADYSDIDNSDAVKEVG